MDKFSSLIFGDKPKKQKQSSSSTITTNTETPRLRPRKTNKKKGPDGIDLDVSQDLPLISIPRFIKVFSTYFLVELLACF